MIRISREKVLSACGSCSIYLVLKTRHHTSVRLRQVWRNNMGWQGLEELLLVCIYRVSQKSRVTGCYTTERPRLVIFVPLCIKLLVQTVTGINHTLPALYVNSTHTTVEARKTRDLLGNTELSLAGDNSVPFSHLP